MKYRWGELKKRNAGTEDYWSRRELQKLNAKEKNRSGNAKNGKCRNDIRTPRKNEEKYAEYRYKRKKSLYTAESMKISWKLWRIKINANISSTIFYIFILLRIKTFISTNNQAETAFYAKEEGRQEKQRNKKLISAWKKHQDGKKPAWIYAEDGLDVSKGKKTLYVLCTYLLINWTRNGNPFINWQSTGNQLTVHQPWISIQSPTKGTTQHERRQKQQNRNQTYPRWNTIRHPPDVRTTHREQSI